MGVRGWSGARRGGVSMLAGFHARTVAAITGTGILILVLFDDIPAQLQGSLGHLGVWTDTFKALSLCGGAWVVALSLGDQKFRLPQTLETLMPFGRYFLPITMIVFGLDHFLYTAFVATLVPGWIPGHVFWIYFAGVALIAAGVAMVLDIQARLASLFLGIMIFLWVLLLHLPRASADASSGKGNEWTSVFEALAFSGVALMLVAWSSRSASGAAITTYPEPTITTRTSY